MQLTIVLFTRCKITRLKEEIKNIKETKIPRNRCLYPVSN